jgi:hypothetical protein
VASGPATARTLFALVRLDAGVGGAELRALAGRLTGPPAAVALAAAHLIEDRVDELARKVADDEVLARASPQPYLHLPRVPEGAPALFAAWVALLRRDATARGSTAFRAFAGDVAEAGFRALQHGAAAEPLLGEGRAFLVDALSAELPGTTDFIAARGMAWLLGALAASDDAARAAIERAHGRFRDEPFARDCATMLAGRPWPHPA